MRTGENGQKKNNGEEAPAQATKRQAELRREQEAQRQSSEEQERVKRATQEAAQAESWREGRSAPPSSRDSDTRSIECFDQLLSSIRLSKSKHLPTQSNLAEDTGQPSVYRLVN